MARFANSTILQKMASVSSRSVARFLQYYYMDESKRPTWEEYRRCDDKLQKKTYEECLDWLTREDVQRAMQVYRKHNRIGDLTKLYETMYSKALGGDVRAADWIVKFQESDYFDESTDEIDDFLSSIDIPGLKGG